MSNPNSNYGPPKRILGIAVRPEADFGDLLNTLLICAGIAGGLMSYSADQAKKDAKIEQVRIDLSSVQAQNKETVTRFENRLDNLQGLIADMSINIAVLK